MTKYSVLVGTGRFTLVKCQPKTGRLHQIRVHMAHRGCPIVGDLDYGLKTPIDRRGWQESHLLARSSAQFSSPRHVKTGVRQKSGSPSFRKSHGSSGH